MNPATQKQKAASSRSRGFSLLELLVALVIIALLVAIAYPSYQGSLRKAKRARAVGALTQLMQLEERAYSQQSTYFEFSGSAEGQARAAWFSGDSAASSSHEISAQACADLPLTQCVQVVATPGTSRVDATFTDPDCGTLSWRSTGERSPENPACWN